MLSLKDLSEYYEKGYIEMLIDFDSNLELKTPYVDDFRLTHEQIRKLLATGKLSIRSKGKPITIDAKTHGDFSVSIERGNISNYPWKIFRKKMRDTGFTYRSESPWFNVYKQGKWDWSRC